LTRARDDEQAHQAFGEKMSSRVFVMSLVSMCLLLGSGGFYIVYLKGYLRKQKLID
jgi:hypothetical protein